MDLHGDLLWRTAERGKDPWSDCPGGDARPPAHGRARAVGAVLHALHAGPTTPGPRRRSTAERLHGIWTELVARGEGRLGWIRTREELLAAEPDGLAGILTMEGASPLRGEIGLLDHFHALGVRSLGLTHNPTNEAGDGCMVPASRRRGLTPFGRELVRRCCRAGRPAGPGAPAPEGVADLFDEVARLPATPPVVTTHTGAHALTAHPRNLTDAQLREVAATGGLAGITLYPPHVRREGRPDTLENVIDHVEHVAEVAGIDHVAIGADFDGFDPPGFPDGGDSPECYGRIGALLRGRGFAEADIEAVLGGNALRVLASVLPTATG